jgi:GTP-binding protein LepA
LRALVFDSKYDEHKGVLAYVRVVDGTIEVQKAKIKRQKFVLMRTGAAFSPLEIGYFAPEATACRELAAGEVGYVATGLKDIRQVRVGDTLTEMSKVKGQKSKVTPLLGYEEPQAMVFASLYPLSAQDFSKLREGLAKLSLSDAALTYRVESSGLGRGFAVGFLGAFHAEIVKERLERDYQLPLLLTRPSVAYRVRLPAGQWVTVPEAKDFPEEVGEVHEPWVRAVLYTPAAFQGPLMSLCERRRGVYRQREYLGEKVRLEYELPLVEMLADFYDQLKSLSSGYASLEWQWLDFRPVEAVRLDVLVHGQRAPALSRVVLKREAYRVGAQLVAKLKELIPPHQFAVPLQAALGGRIIARETVPARRKNVLAKLSGGHRERKDKVLARQKEGKKRMALFGQVAVPEEALRLTLTET